MVDKIIYGTGSENNIPIVYTKRANAPERGEVFTAQAIKDKDKRDLIVNVIDYHTGYVKKNLEDAIPVVPGEYYRFKIVDGPFQKNNHNYFYVVPLRGVGEGENFDLNMIDARRVLAINRLAEFLMGMGWDRRKRRNYKLSKSQQNWDWFYKNFM